MNAQKIIEQAYSKAASVALKELERMARDLMHEHCFNIFCLGMGTWCFWDEERNQIDDSDERVADFQSFIDEWDEILKLTGCPLKLTRSQDGKIKRQTMW